MEEDTSTQDYVAPLQIRKPQRDEARDDEGENVTIAEPTSAKEDHLLPRTRFQDFLRASYPFQPATTTSPSTVTLALNAGDIILVHSVHTNGWADGTLLETGARGWLPTNYCEAYEYGTMRPLLKALTDFWDIIRSGDELNTALFDNHDYMRGVVAGVRFLLEKSDCLTRESRWVKQYDTIRRTRKALLADLSNLVKAAKFLQQLAGTGTDIDEIGDLLDDMLLRAFRVVTQAVNFFDIWSEEIASREPTLLASLQPFTDRPGSIQDAHSIDSRDTNLLPSPYSIRRSSLASPVEDKASSRKRPVSTSSRRQTLVHRMSYNGHRSKDKASNLASEQLNTTYDAFLGVLAAFLGSHMQSRSSSELLLTTQLAVKACKSLLRVVETVMEHEPNHADGLCDAKDSMCDKITELVEAAKQVFRPLQSNDDDVVYLPSEGIHLVNAATACVSGAGRCVSKARLVLENAGDFELDLPQSALPSPTEPKTLAVADDYRHENADIDGERDKSPQKPQLVIATLDIPRAVQELDTAVSETNPFWRSVDHPEPSPTFNVSLTSSSNVTAQPTTLNRPYLRSLIHSTGSQTTLISSIRDSGPSFVSDGSTRATSPDRSKQLPASPDLDNFTPENDDSEGENEVMEQTFAHELLISPDSRVLGGTLNAIVEKLTAHDSTPDTLFVSTVSLTFRLFTSPIDFAKALAHRFEYVGRTPRIAGPVRLRVYNVLKSWLEVHWKDEYDASALSYITEFARNIMLLAVPSAGERLLELTTIIMETHAPSSPRTPSLMGRTNQAVSNNDNATPTPAISKAQIAALKTWKSGGPAVNIVDLDPLEVARQITIRESVIFCSILPEELLTTEFTKQSSSLAINVRAMAQLSTDLANLVADSILQLEEAKKRAALIKQWIKIAKKCLELNNYDSLMAIVCSINSSTVLRLKKTWDLINQKTKNAFEELKKVVDVSKNYSALRQRIAAHTPPCLPFVGMYLTDLTFVDHGNPSTRQLKTDDGEISLINFDKHTKTAKIISDLQRFQIPYRLAEVSELQSWLQDEFIRVRAAGERNFQNHYRRSLVLEPREAAPVRPTTVSTLSSISIAGHKDKFDFLAWTQFGRDKTASVNS